MNKHCNFQSTMQKIRCFGACSQDYIFKSIERTLEFSMFLLQFENANSLADPVIQSFITRTLEPHHWPRPFCKLVCQSAKKYV